MGDTGSLIVGALMGYLLICFHEHNQTHAVPDMNASISIMFAMIAIPVLDAVKVILIRLKERRKPWHPDNCHFHHALLKFKLSHLQITLLINSVALLIIVVSFSLSFIRAELLLLLISIVVGILLYIPAIIDKYNKNKSTHVR
jgi:UDP-N-acetylmuramyl pentapeptide phosphotransferase/UDP-N-acetylglucosamine-1-phosphate transferase